MRSPALAVACWHDRRRARPRLVPGPARDTALPQQPVLIVPAEARREAQSTRQSPRAKAEAVKVRNFPRTWIEAWSARRGPKQVWKPEAQIEARSARQSRKRSSR